MPGFENPACLEEKIFVSVVLLTFFIENRQFLLENEERLAWIYYYIRAFSFFAFGQGAWRYLYEEQKLRRRPFYFVLIGRLFLTDFVTFMQDAVMNKEDSEYYQEIIIHTMIILIVSFIVLYSILLFSDPEIMNEKEQKKDNGHGKEVKIIDDDIYNLEPFQEPDKLYFRLRDATGRVRHIELKNTLYNRRILIQPVEIDMKTFEIHKNNARNSIKNTK